MSRATPPGQGPDASANAERDQWIEWRQKTDLLTMGFVRPPYDTGSYGTGSLGPSAAAAAAAAGYAAPAVAAPPPRACRERWWLPRHRPRTWSAQCWA